MFFLIFLTFFFYQISGDRRYICTQGPLPQTVGDFWEMVLQEKVEAVVMLCDTVELNRPKCHQYWPKDNSPDSVRLTL